MIGVLAGHHPLDATVSLVLTPPVPAGGKSLSGDPARVAGKTCFSPLETLRVESCHLTEGLSQASFPQWVDPILGSAGKLGLNLNG